MRVLLSILLMLLLCGGMVTQAAAEIVMTNADIQIRFSGEVDWISGGDMVQTVFSVDSISYSTEPLSTDIKHTTKLDEPHAWEAEMWRIGTDAFRKAIFVITIYEATNRIYELRAGNRYAGDDLVGWSLPTEDKIIGRPGKPINVR